MRRAPVTRAAEPGLDAIPAWLPPAVFALLTVIVFREFILGGTSMLGVDSFALSYFARNFYTQFVHNFHRFPLWDPLIYGGMPFIDGMHGDVFYPPSLAMFFLDARTMWGWKMALHVFLAGVFMYAWLRELGISRGSAMLGAIIFMLGADLVTLVFPGGDGKLFVSALSPLAFLLTERAVRYARIRDYAALALGIALLVFTSHMQLAYFCIWGISLYFVFRALQRLRQGEWGAGRLGANFGAFVLAGLLGVGAAAAQFVPPLQYLREWSHRAEKTVHAEQAGGYEYSTTFSLHPEEIMSLVVPEFVGDNVQTETRSGASYWGRNDFKINNEYAGLLGLLLLPLLFIRKRRARTWFFSGLAVLSLLYALGADTPFFRLFYLIPGVRLFRAPSLIIFLYGLSVATLAALAWDRASELGRAPDEVKTARRALWITVAVFGVLAVLASSGVLITMWRGIFYTTIGTNKIAALATHLDEINTGFWIAFAIALGVAAAWEGYSRGIWSARGALIAVCVIAFLDQFRASNPFVHATALMNQNADPITFTPDESLQFLQQRQAAGEVFRVLDLTNGAYPNNVMAIHGIEQMAGHHGNEIGRYRELIGGPEPANLRRSLTLFDLTNTAYVTGPPELNAPGFTEVFRGSRSTVFRREGALPRAYLVGRVDVVSDTAAVSRLLSSTFDYQRTALLPAPLPANVSVQADPSGTVRWLTRGANMQRLQVTSDRPALLMVLDNFYSAWRARVDNRETPILRANYTFRAVPIPAGTHEVSFTYSTNYLRAPVLASVTILLLLLALAFGAPLLELVRNKPAAA